jgi:hypothetical protein
MSSTSLGMPALPPRTSHPSWKQAWDAALYGPGGYLRREPLALQRDRDEVLDLVVAESAHARSVVLLGAAGLLAPDLVARRPELDVRADLPDGFDGLVVAVDWLAHVPTHVVRADDEGRVRILHVDPVTGTEVLGSRVDDSGVPATIGGWLEQHWALTTPGARAELGTAREAAWRDVVRRVAGGRAIAVEHGHLRDTRPLDGSLRNPAGLAAVPDGTRDLVADVALDALAAACGGVVVTGSGPDRVVVG